MITYYVIFYLPPEEATQLQIEINVISSVLSVKNAFFKEALEQARMDMIFLSSRFDTSGDTICCQMTPGKRSLRDEKPRNPILQACRCGQRGRIGVFSGNSVEERILVPVLSRVFEDDNGYNRMLIA